MGMAPLVTPSAGQLHLLQCHRTAVNFQGVGGVKLDFPRVIAERISQCAVLDGDIRRALHGEQLVGDRAADGLAAEIQGKLAGPGNDTVFRLVEAGMITPEVGLQLLIFDGKDQAIELMKLAPASRT